MKPSKKLFLVEIRAIETDGGREVDMRSEKVIACTADEAMKRVRLRSNKDYVEFYAGVELFSEIDKL